MKIYQKYIFKKFLFSFLFSYIFFAFFYILCDSLSNIDEIIKHKINFLRLAKYYLFNLASLSIAIFIPLSSVVANAFCLTELNKNNEILALRSFGISNFKIIIPIIIFLFLLSLFSLYFCEYWLPEISKKYKELKSTIFSQKVQKKQVLKDIMNFSEKGQAIIISEFHLKKNLAKGILIFDQNNFKKIYAQEGIYKDKKWILKKVSVSDLFSSEKPIFFYNELKLHLPPPQKLMLRSGPFEILPTKILKEKIKYFKKINAYEIAKNLITELNKKYVICFLPIFLNLTFLGIFLRIKKTTYLLSNLGMSVLCSFVFYVALSISVALGKTGFLNPFLSCWLLPFLACLWGILNFLSLN